MTALEGLHTATKSNQRGARKKLGEGIKRGLAKIQSTIQEVLDSLKSSDSSSPGISARLEEVAALLAQRRDSSPSISGAGRSEASGSAK